MIRLFVAAPFALGCALLLFSFMAWMVDTSHRRTPEASDAVRFDMIMANNEQDVQRRKRTVPEQPKTPQLPEQMPTAQVDTPQTQLSAIELPSLNLNTGIDGLAISTPSFGDFEVNQQVMPLYRVEPRYPSRALDRGIEGYVVMTFTIDATGKPTDITLVESNPKNVFDREAARALAKWKYQPKTDAGKAVPQYGQTVKLEFKMAQ
ncbi:energy transducer TonB (plasmid) [Vibrio sp. qd031]|uniref:energy transducer TonB n=1 Tax=Vibrio sp. qd031 TaxID=1603038 RepID=UPI000A113762|nr:energy transducer TonB [Vibrio sp. qd031]ORT52599.1 energy transducer TonB [Vibrio sp. qd031]